MQSVPKFTIIVPVFILISAIILRFTSPPKQQITPPPQPPPTAVPQQNKTITDQLFSGKTMGSRGVDLQGPYACSYKNDKTDAKVFIENKKIYAKFVGTEETSFLLLNGDCLYNWKEGASSGTKMCGIGQYVNLLESFSKLPFFSPEMLFSYISQMQQVESIDATFTKQIFHSCQKNFIDKTLFEIPQRIPFIEEKITGLPKGLEN